MLWELPVIFRFHLLIPQGESGVGNFLLALLVAITTKTIDRTGIRPQGEGYRPRDPAHR
jgi:hypothetical protein